MDIGEFDLMRNFINEKGLSNQYQEWRKSYIKDYENVIVNFHCLNKKYEFQITIAKKQLKTFVFNCFLFHFPDCQSRKKHKCKSSC